MKTSILIYATCFIVTGCSAQLRFPSLSSALSSLTGFGGASNSASSSSGSSQNQAGQTSPYSGFVRDYGRNLMMAMSNIYPTLFKPPQQQQPQQQQQSQPASQSPFDQAFSASQYASQNLFNPSQSQPSFSFGGSTFSISPSLPFGLQSGGGSQAQGASGGSHSPFSASFGSSINSPSSFGPLSSSPFLQSQSMPSFAPASSYNAAFEAANGGPSMGPNSFSGLGSQPSGLGNSANALSNQALLSQPSNSQPINSYSTYNGQHDSAGPLVNQQHQQQQQAPLNQAAHSSPQFGQQHNQPGSQYGSQQYRPDMMSIAASAPVPSSSSYSSNYGNIPSGPSQQAPVSSSSYQQASYR